MKEKRLKSFLWLQCCLLMLFAGALPQWDLMSALIGLNLDALAMLCALVFSIIGGIHLYRFFREFKSGGAEVPVPFFVSALAGIVLALFTSINVLPDWCGYLALVALGIAMWMAQESLQVNWAKASSRGAYLILLALALRFYQDIDGHFLTNVAALVGFVFYWIGLGVLMTSLDAKGITGCSRLKLSLIFAVIALLVGFIPLLGWLSTILMIISFIFEFLGYGALASSGTLAEKGRKGAKSLRWCMIFMIIIYFFNFIPFVGGKIVAFASIVAVFIVFAAWRSIIFGLESESKTE